MSEHKIGNKLNVEKLMVTCNVNRDAKEAFNLQRLSYASNNYQHKTDNIQSATKIFILNESRWKVVKNATTKREPKEHHRSKRQIQSE